MKLKTLRFLGRGIGHEDTDKNCQDKLSCTYIPGDKRYIFAISDGCSSSKYAEEAAQCNIDVINKIFSRFSIAQLNRDSFIELYPPLADCLSGYEMNDITSCLDMVLKFELFRKVQTFGAPAHDFCATLLFAVIEKENTVFGHIGDGNIIFYDKNGNTVFRSAEENGEDSSHTFFTISDDFTDRFHYETIPTASFNSLILFSDGPQTMFRLEGGTIEKGAHEIVVGPIAEGRVSSERELAAELQKSLANAMHYGFDDWSIIAAVKTSGGLPDIEPVSLKQLFMETYAKNSVSGGDSSDTDNSGENAPKESPKSDKARSIFRDIFSREADGDTQKDSPEKSDIPHTSPTPSDCRGGDADNSGTLEIHKKAIIHKIIIN